MLDWTDMACPGPWNLVLLHTISSRPARPQSSIGISLAPLPLLISSLADQDPLCLVMGPKTCGLAPGSPGSAAPPSAPAAVELKEQEC